ncbi:MAG: transcription antitermination factor NusB [Jaaginema sp. PMC 1079.18]|nr:transcription antitermination factor NusB [Jaaginema sp. PMC 1080.18]MEC4849670.1 transcription antitermination factor NusB [Jaaginema sp. PMC 1079.18]MEC4866070.1 transcription antitermination factor NusB [Jaaginema sp. PMC 1078.18]
MPPRKQPRRIARELALLSLSQIKTEDSESLSQQKLNDLVLAAIRTLTTELQDALEAAAAEVRRGGDRLLTSETRANDVRSAKAMVQEALELTQTAINRLGDAVELPEFVQLANQHEVREYAIELIDTVSRRQIEIDDMINGTIVNWQLSRLPKIDQDILRIAVAEMWLLGLDTQFTINVKFAINEAVELAKRYSEAEGYRLINGVLRRVSEKLKAEAPL